MAALWIPALWSDDWTNTAALLERCLDGPRPQPSPAVVERLGSTWMLLREKPGVPIGDVHRALSDAVRFGEQLGDPKVLGRAQSYVADALLGMGRPDEARRLVQAAWEQAAAVGFLPGQGWAAHVLGYEALHRGAAEEACQLLEAVLADLRPQASVAFDPLMAHLEAALAFAAALHGDGELSRLSAASAVAAARRLTTRGVLVLALSRATQAELLLGDDPAAARFLRELLELLRDLGARRFVAEALETTVALVPIGDPEAASLAARLLGHAEALCQALGEPAAALPAVRERVRIRRRQLEEQLAPGSLGTETNHGRRATTDQALRWSLVLLSTGSD